MDFCTERGLGGGFGEEVVRHMSRLLIFHPFSCCMSIGHVKVSSLSGAWAEATVISPHSSFLEVRLVLTASARSKPAVEDA